MLTDDEVRKIRDGAVMGGRVPDYTDVWDIADELLKRRHPWRPISELGEEHKGSWKLLGRAANGTCGRFSWGCPLGRWISHQRLSPFSDFTHFMEIPELEDV